MSIDALQSKIRKLKNPTMLGLDPSPELIPPALLEQARAEKSGAEALAEAYRLFGRGILSALHGLVPAVKLQEACFTALGAPGLAVMQELMAHARRLGYYVLLDGGWSDVEHIACLRARAAFEGFEGIEPLACDGVTLNAYLGSDAIKPWLPYLKGDKPKNVFVIVRSSNRSARELQDLLSGDRNVHTAVADMTLRWSLDLFGKCGYGEVCAVVGASGAGMMRELRRKYDRLFFLVPGFGVQGAAMTNIRYAFDRLGHGAVVCAARLILGAWQMEEYSGLGYDEAARAAAEKMKNQISNYVTVM